MLLLLFPLSFPSVIHIRFVIRTSISKSKEDQGWEKGWRKETQDSIYCRTTGQTQTGIPREQVSVSSFFIPGPLNTLLKPQSHPSLFVMRLTDLLVSCYDRVSYGWQNCPNALSDKHLFRLTNHHHLFSCLFTWRLSMLLFLILSTDTWLKRGDRIWLEISNWTSLKLRSGFKTRGQRSRRQLDTRIPWLFISWLKDFTIIQLLPWMMKMRMNNWMSMTGQLQQHLHHLLILI